MSWDSRARMGNKCSTSDVGIDKEIGKNISSSCVFLAFPLSDRYIHPQYVLLSN